MPATPAPPSATVVTARGWWWKALVCGAALWAVTAIVTSSTQNTNLVPTVILLGSFLVPFCVVLFVVERARGTIDIMLLLAAFFIGGIFGVLGASVLESRLSPSVWIYVGVGAIEELVKAVVFLVVGARVAQKTALKGALLGATVGAGFAAFESAGYAFNASLTRLGRIDLDALLQTEAVRGLLTPVGHVLWTAILGAAIFGAASAAGKYRLTGGVVLAYVVVVALHAGWDSMGFIAAYLGTKVTGGVHYELAYGQLLPAVADNAGAWATGFYVVGLAVVSLLGVLALRHWSRGLATAPSRA
ncbi:PrsW family glutamic-type intramembrane protease [Cellulomonas sp. PhB143]|uniref:PrsW family glutamic-type intramembrane protease n=1 Tax=Cellulomonas sp. PhB143 TaxID=2485186 RepID=UPI000FA8E9E0|nr:PrsW family glutamic-type intramembrane protease [Cellulomonas sp. PhB143]ROS74456.1 RsiW-degrading membrane proteinase PrsW (M82 family) [Cellulomonas sp. PhB143]